MFKKVLLPLVLVILLSSSILAGCATPTAKESGVVKIGCAFPMSGGQAVLGEMYESLCVMLFEEQNAKGGLDLDGKNCLIEWQIEDTEYDAANTISAVEKLINQFGAQILIGPVPSAGTIAVAPILEQANVPFMYTSGTDMPLRDVKAGKLRTPFRGAFSLDCTYPLFTDIVMDKYPDIDTIAYIAPDDESGRANWRSAEKIYNWLGKTTFEPVFVPRGTKDYYPYLSPILDKNPDMIDLDNSTVGDIALMCKQLHELNYQGIRFTLLSPISQSFLDTAGGYDALGTFISMSLPESSDPEFPPELKEMVDALVARWGKEFPAATKYGLNPYVVLGALEKAKSADPDAFIKALEEGQFDSPWGKTKTATIHVGHLVFGDTYLSEVKNGKFTILAKATGAEAIKTVTSFYEVVPYE